MVAKIEMSFDEFRSLSPSTQNEILSLLTSKKSTGQGSQESDDAELDFGPASLSLNEARRLVANLSTQSKSLLKAVVSGGGRARVRDLLKALKLRKWQDLRGIQAGITKRTRTVTGNAEAYILKWDDTTYDNDDPDTYEDAYLYVTDVTRESLTKVL